MGLDLYVSDETRICGWSYSGFYIFRQRLAEMIGIENLDEMEGFGGKRKWEEVNDDIEILINHSDCDGIISGDDAQKLLPRLRTLNENFPDSPVSLSIEEDFSYDKKCLEKLIEAIEENPGKQIVFS